MGKRIIAVILVLYGLMQLVVFIGKLDFLGIFESLPHLFLVILALLGAALLWRKRR